MKFDPAKLNVYPEEPGVYLMKDQTGAILYIGKAKNLKSRIKQYFAEAHDTREMVPYLIKQVATVDTMVTLTEKDALILENQLIKKHAPKYNILLKDDKTFIHLLLTPPPWPMLKIVRFKTRPNKKIGTLFGPYTSALAARKTYDLLSRLFPLRQCSDGELKQRTRPCLLYDMKRCIAPCVGKCSQEEYAVHVENAQKFLKGDDQSLLKALKEQRDTASFKLEFEKAAEFQKMIQQIEHVTEVQHIERLADPDCDVLGLYREGDATLIAILSFREGHLTGSLHFSFHLTIGDDSDLISSFLIQRYQQTADVPKEVLLPAPIGDASFLEEILNTTILFPQKGQKKELIAMAEKNAKALFMREQDAQSLKEKMLLDLQECLELTRFPRHIECFDTSHLSGGDAVASLVSFVNGEKDKKGNRLFKIKTAQKGDDYGAMREVLYRHFKKQKEKASFCDLLIVDGGKGQLNCALEVFKALEIASVDVIGLTKEDARHDRGLTQERIFKPYTSEPIIIDRKSPLLFLLQKIRDASHTQAISYHRKKRSERTISSALDDIPGIGPTKKKALLTHFGSIARIKSATQAQLEDLPQLNKKDIDMILRWSTKLPE
jgi:excinuclease ABC subunit C